MNIRFIILKAGVGDSESTFNPENYEIAYGSTAKGSENFYYGKEFTSYAKAEAELLEVRKMFPDLSYRLAAVWD